MLYYANYHQFANFAPVHSPLVITWSLAVEEHFYFAFPLLMIVSKSRLAPVLSGVIAAVLVWRIILVFGFHVPMPRTYFATDTRIDSIAWGCLLSVLIANRSPVLARLASPPALAASVVLLAISFAIRSNDFRETVRYSLQGAALMPIFCALFWKDASLLGLRSLLQSGVARYVGNISYSLYLYHFLVLSAATALLPQSPAAKLATLAFSVLLASASYYLVENPLRRFGSRLAHSMERTAPEQANPA